MYTILCIVLISTPYFINPANSINASQANDGSSKSKAIPAQLGDNSGSLQYEQQQMWYSFDSTLGIGYQLHLNGQGMQMGIQVIDQNHTTLYKKGPYNDPGINGFVGKGLVYIIIIDFGGAGTYTLNIETVAKGQTKVNPITIGLGSTSVTINSSQQESIFLYYPSPISDYVSFNLQFSTPGVAIKATLQNNYIKNYKSTVQESLEVPVDFYYGLNILLNISTNVENFNLTILLNRVIGPAGAAPSSAIPMTLDSPQTSMVDNNLTQKLEFYNITLPRDDWYMINATIPSSFGIHVVMIYNENHETVYSNGYMFTNINFLQMTAGNYMIKILSAGEGSNITITLSQRDPTPGSDLAHAVIIDNSSPMTFTSTTRYVYMNLTLDPSSYHTMSINIDTDITTSRSLQVLINVPGQIDLGIGTISNPIFLPKGQGKIFVIIDLFHTEEVNFTVSLNDITTVKYGSQVSAMSINLNDSYTITPDYVGQQMWVKFYAAKNVQYKIIADSLPAFYKEDGSLLGFPSDFNFIGSGEEIYACFSIGSITPFNFSFVAEDKIDNPVINYYSQNFKKGDYVKYKTSHTVNGEKQDGVFPYNFKEIQVNILQNDVMIENKEFSGYYLNYDFTRNFLDNQLARDKIMNSLLLPIRKVEKSGTLDSFDILQQQFSGYKLSEDNQRYYLSDGVIDPIDFSNTTTTVVYDKINLNLISYSTQRITTDGNIDKQQFTLIDSRISGHGSGFETTTTTKKGDAPFKTPFPMEGVFIMLIILPIVVKKSRYNR